MKRHSVQICRKLKSRRGPAPEGRDLYEIKDSGLRFLKSRKDQNMIFAGHHVKSVIQ